jgi:predicted metal-dependent hydrolase
MALLKNNSPHYITLDGVRHPLIAKKHSRARHIVVRYDAKEKTVRLTIPKYVSLAAGLAFAESRTKWLEARKREQSENIPFASGTIIPLFGEDVTLLHQAGRGVAELKDATLMIPGDIEFMPRRITDYIKKRLKEEILALAEKHTPEWKNRLNITMRETTSRWGSCNRKGDLSICWRLAFAPYDILEYVVCHELAHLTHLNHSPRYWKHLETMYPQIDYAEDWLRKNGASLWRYRA